MKKFLAKRRFEGLALAIAFVCVLLHRAADGTTVSDEFYGGELKPSLMTKFLRGIQSLESRATDLQFQFRGARAPHPDIIVAAVDEASAQRHGLWPWPRELTAKAVSQLSAAGARAIGMDIFFPDAVDDKATAAYKAALTDLEKEIASKPELATQLAAYKQKLVEESSKSPDAVLADAFANAPMAVQGATAYPPREAEGFKSFVNEHNRLVKPFLITETRLENDAVMELPIDKLEMYTMFSAQSSRAMIAEKAARMGHINTAPDPDGGLRRTPIFIKLTSPGGLIPSLELAMAAAYYGGTPQAIYDKHNKRLTGAEIRNKDGVTLAYVPLSESEPVTYINHLGPARVFPTVSLSDIVDGVPSELAKVKGKAVIVGVTSVGGFDQRVTPFSSIEPGVFTHGSFLSNILDRSFLSRPWWYVVVEMLFMLGSALLLAMVVPRVRFLYKGSIVAGLIVAWLAVDQLLFASGSMLATVMPTLSVFLTGFGVIFLGYLAVDREKAMVRDIFSKYVDKRVVEQLVANPDKVRLGGDKKDMSVLFSDIRGFTTLAERMTPTALVEFINEYLTPMTDIVFEHEGTLDKYIGDAVMAFWGAPIEQPDHALRACKAAMRMLDKLEELKKEWRARNLPDISIGVGINSGAMTVGNMGSHGHFNYTVMGDAVNLASRLEGTNKEYETNVLISEATYLQVATEVTARRLGAVRVKGKRKPVRIYELRKMGAPEGVEKKAIEAFEQAVDAYAERKWDEADTLFNAVLKVWPGDAPSQRYLEEIAVFRQTPPGPRWDGVYTATTK